MTRTKKRILHRALCILHSALCIVLAASAAKTAYATPAACHLAISVAAGKIPAGVTVADLPVLVRLSESIDGFHYADFALPSGGDLFFTDADGTAIPHEIDTWDETGTSLVWVKIPSAASGTVIHAYWGDGLASGIAQAGVWSGYGGVWHFGEASGTAFDATGNGFDGTPTGYWADELVATDGVIGKARYQPTHSKNTTREEGNRGYMAIPSLRSLGYGDTFAVSMWAKIDTSSWGGLSPRLFNKTGGWIAQFPINSTSKLTLYGAATSKNVQPVVPNLTAWGHVTLVYSGTTASCYTNGFLSATGTINAAADSDNVLGIGWQTRWAEGFGDLACRYDELRISGSVPSADRVAAEYAAMADSNFLTFGTAAAGAVPPLPGAFAVARTNGVWYATASLLKGEGALSVIVIDATGAMTEVPLSASASAPATFGTALPVLAADAGYSIVAYGMAGTVTNATPPVQIATYDIALAASADAADGVDGAFTVSRPSSAAACAYDLKVAYAASGTAVAGTHYAALSGTVTIPAGASSVTIPVSALDKTTAETTLTLTLVEGPYGIAAASESASIAVSTVRAAAALVWSAGTSATELTAPTNWTPVVDVIMDRDTLSFTGDGTSAYRFTATNDMAVKSFAFANGTSPAVVDLGGHTLSNYMADSTGSFKQTGAGPFVLQNGTVAAYSLSFATPTLAMTNVCLAGSREWMKTSLTFNNNNARYLFDNVTFLLSDSWYGQMTFKGDAYAVDARNMVYVYPKYVPQIVIGGNNADVRFHGAGTGICCGLNMSGCGNKVTVNEGRFYGAYDTQGTLTMNGTNLEFIVTNSLGDRSQLSIPYLDNAVWCAVRVLKGGKFAFTRIDDKLTSSFAIDGCSNLVEVADGTLTLPTLRFGHRDGAAFGGNELAVRGDEAVVTFSNGCYVGNTNQPSVTLSFASGPEGFGGAAPVRQTGTGKNVFVATNTVFKVDGRALTRTRDHGRFALPLISFRSNAEAETAFDAAALAAFNARLVSRPRGGTLSLETSGNYRILTWNYAKSGTVLMLR